MQNTTLLVKHAAGEYPVYLGNNLLSKQKWLRSLVHGKQVFIVTDENVAPHYLSKMTDAFSELQCDTLILPAGEQHKTLATFEKIIDAAATHQHHRDTTFIALGGGVITDMVGFAAACYQRGVALIQIPTSLLAQVDAAVGGKTAVNHAMGKNFIGAFYPPSVVITSLETLATLPDREFRAGFAEIIKAALIQDAPFFDWLEKNSILLLARDEEALLFAIQRSCEIKRDIVIQDEKEKNKRAILNLGHTFAHAIEKTLGFGTWLHGEAVAYGIVAASVLSKQLGLLDDDHCHRIQTIFSQYGLLKKLPENISAIDLTTTMQNDKKVKSKRLRLILLSAIGTATIIEAISTDKITAAWGKKI